jgi:hypothetical protein
VLTKERMKKAIRDFLLKYSTTPNYFQEKVQVPGLLTSLVEKLPKKPCKLTNFKKTMKGSNP